MQASRSQDRKYKKKPSVRLLLFDSTAGVTRKLVRAKSGPGGPLLAAKIGPTPDHFWLPKMVRAAKSGPGISTCRKQFLALRRLCRTHYYMQPPSKCLSVHTHMHDPANMREHALLIVHSGSSNIKRNTCNSIH